MGLVVPCGLLATFGGFSPVDLSPEIWFDASDSSTLYDATTGGSLVVADGTVARWQDKSGNSRHATQATSGSRPTRKTAIQNSLDVLRFDGADWLASVAFGGTETYETHIIAVSRATQYRVIAAWASDSFVPNPGGHYMAVDNSGRFECLQSGGSGSGTANHKISVSSVLATGTWRHLAELGASTLAGHTLRVDGAAVSMTTNFAGDPGTYTKTATAFGIGAWNNGSTAAQCDIGEVVHFNRHLTTDERTRLESYLLTKWGLP